MKKTIDVSKKCKSIKTKAIESNIEDDKNSPLLISEYDDKLDINAKLSVSAIKRYDFLELRNRAVRTLMGACAQTPQGFQGFLLTENDKLYINSNSDSALSGQNSTIYENILMDKVLGYIRSLSLRTSKKPETPVMARVEDMRVLSSSHFLFNLFFGIPLSKSFHCILPEHVKSKDRCSARFEIQANGKVVYHCYDCHKRYNFIEFIQKILNTGYMNSIKFICNIFGICYESEWQKNRRADISALQDYIVKDMKETYPKLFSYMRRSNLITFYLLFLTISRSFLFDKSVIKTDRQLFIMGIAKLIELFNSLGYKISYNKCFLKVKKLTQLGLLKNLDDKDIPPKILRSLNEYAKRNNLPYHVSVYEIPSFSTLLFKHAEETVQANIDKNMRMSYYNKETEYRTNGLEAAKSQFVQTNDKSFVSSSTEKFYNHYKVKALSLINKNRFTTEKELLASIKGYKKCEKERYSYTCLPQLLRDLNLTRTVLTKELKDLFLIKSKDLYCGRSKIIYRNSKQD